LLNTFEMGQIDIILILDSSEFSPYSTSTVFRRKKTTKNQSFDLKMRFYLVPLVVIAVVALLGNLEVESYMGWRISYEIIWTLPETLIN